MQRINDVGFPKVRFSRVTRREKGPLSRQRIYLRVRCGSLYFDVSAFIVGNCLIIGYWLHSDPPGISDLFEELPIVRWLMQEVLKPPTYYRVDRLEAFQHIVHDSILEVVSGLNDRVDPAQFEETEERPLWKELQG